MRLVAATPVFDAHVASSPPSGSPFVSPRALSPPFHGGAEGGMPFLAARSGRARNWHRRSIATRNYSLVVELEQWLVDRMVLKYELDVVAVWL